MLIRKLNPFLWEGHVACRVSSVCYARQLFSWDTWYELQNDKTNKIPVRQAKTQISLGIRPVWSESSLSAWRNFGSLASNWADSEDSDQTGWMPKLIWIIDGRTGDFVGYVMRWFIAFLAYCSNKTRSYCYYCIPAELMINTEIISKYIPCFVSL